MSVNGRPIAGFDFTQLNKTKSSDHSGKAGSKSANLDDSFALQMAQFQSQQLGSLMDAAFGGNSVNAGTRLAALQGAQTAAADPLSVLSGISQANGLTAVGRISALRDPQSAYNMMSLINNQDANFKAQYSELSQMKSALSAMQQAGQSLSGINASTSNDSIKSQLQAFASQYNAWVQQFDADMKEGGVLANTRAAEVSRFELRQNIESVFNGAQYGVRGLYDLGLTLNPTTKLASLDSTKLDSVLASNKQGALAAVQDFSANFVKSAALLNTPGNFISNQLNNLSRAIAYIANNKSSLQAEFGTGDPAKPSEQVAKALAAYNQITGTNT